MACMFKKNKQNIEKNFFLNNDLKQLQIINVNFNADIDLVKISFGKNSN